MPIVNFISYLVNRYYILFVNNIYIIILLFNFHISPLVKITKKEKSTLHVILLISIISQCFDVSRFNFGHVTYLNTSYTF